MSGDNRVGVTRRELLRGAGGMALVATAVRLGGGPVVSTSSTSRGLHSLALSDFAGAVGTSFDVRVDGGGTVPLTLVEAADRLRGTQTRRPRTGDAFSLLFLGDVERELPNATHSFSSPALGRFALFVTAIGPGRGGQRYEAVVNRQTVAR